MNSLEVYFLPCTCGHERREHVSRSWEYDWSQSLYLGGCFHDQAYFKGMCLCSSYRQMTKLEYLEYKFNGK